MLRAANNFLRVIVRVRKTVPVAAAHCDGLFYWNQKRTAGIIEATSGSYDRNTIHPVNLDLASVEMDSIRNRARTSSIILCSGNLYATNLSVPPWEPVAVR